MASGLKHILVSYDISDPYRLGRIGKAMKDYGQRVLKSVFECYIDDATLKEMKSKMEGLMEIETDSVRYYFICEKCIKEVAAYGKKDKLEEYEEVVII